MAAAGEASIAKVTNALTPLYRQMIEASPFMALATVGPEGFDCSPRGDFGGVVRVQDDKTLLLPDWRGNNRVDSLSNIVRDPRIALMFLIPGSNTTMRINGRARRLHRGEPAGELRDGWQASAQRRRDHDRRGLFPVRAGGDACRTLEGGDISSIRQACRRPACC